MHVESLVDSRAQEAHQNKIIKMSCLEGCILAVVGKAEHLPAGACDMRLRRVIQRGDAQSCSRRTPAFVGQPRKFSKVTISECVVLPAGLADEERTRLIENLNRLCRWLIHDGPVGLDT